MYGCIGANHFMKLCNYFSLALLFVVTTSTLFGQRVPLTHEASPEELARANQANKVPTAKIDPDIKPYFDVGNFEYVLMSAEDQGVEEVRTLRELIARNLPESMKLVILTTSAKAQSVRQTYEQWIEADRLIVASDKESSNSNGFWARDSFPVPVWNEALSEASLVSLRYFRTFKSAATVASAVGANLESHPQVFVGGNLLADEDGNCFAIDSSRLFGLNDVDLQNLYGCRKVSLLPHIAGIGDVDEVIKPLPNRRMLSNQLAYKSKLEALGYTVISLPSIANSYRTYANALIVGDVVFMPVYSVPTDAQATAVYERLGYRVVPIPSRYLSDQLHGSIHCQTMAYPSMPKELLLKALGVEE
jgi:hypothetical protein